MPQTFDAALVANAQQALAKLLEATPELAAASIVFCFQPRYSSEQLPVAVTQQQGGGPINSPVVLGAMSGQLWSALNGQLLTMHQMLQQADALIGERAKQLSQQLETIDRETPKSPAGTNIPAPA